MMCCLRERAPEYLRPGEVDDWNSLLFLNQTSNQWTVDGKKVQETPSEEGDMTLLERFEEALNRYLDNNDPKPVERQDVPLSSYYGNHVRTGIPQC